MSKPLRYADRHILYGGGGGVRPLYHLDTISYPWLGTRLQNDWRLRLWQFAYEVEADFSLWRVNRAYPTERYLSENMALLDARRQDPERWADYLRSHESHLATMRPFTPEVYLAPSLAADAWRGKRLISREQGVAMRSAEEAMRETVMSHLPGRPATTREIQWLLARTMVRGLGEPDLDDYWTPEAVAIVEGDTASIEPLADSMLSPTNAAITETSYGLEVETEQGISYQAVLALGALPEFMNFPNGAELLFAPLEMVGRPVDAVLHAEWVDNERARSVVAGKVQDADIVFGEATHGEHGPLSSKHEKTADKARRLLDRLEENDRPPMLRVAMSLVARADSAAGLEAAVAEVRRAYGRITLHRPLGLQLQMFRDHILGTDGGTIRDYQRWMTLDEFSGLMPIADHAVGSATGPYFAHTVSGGRRPVRFYAGEAAQKKRASGILAAGTQGGGKTIALQKLAYDEIERGGMVIDNDPKPDHRLHELPEFKGRSHVIDLDNVDDFAGLLDPLIIGSLSRKEDLASSYYIEILPSIPSAWATQIRKATRTVLTEPDPCGYRVIDWLQSAKDEDAKKAGEALAVWSEAGVARLGFSNGSRGKLEARAPYTTIRPSALTLPDPRVPRADYDESERLSAASLKLIAAYALALANDDRTVHKLIVLDECGIFLATPGGQRLASDLVLQGRAKNATVAFGAQFFSHIGDLRKLIGTLMVFGQESREEAQEALDHLGLDRSDERLISQVMANREGVCLMRDIYGRVGKIQVDLVEARLLEALDTTPEQQAIELV